MSSLLPKTHKDFSSKQYWNTFFAKRGAKAFEWYGEYAELCGLLHKYIRPKDKILVAGCGNSTISADLYRVGYKDMVNADISEIVIRQMQEKYNLRCPEMKWVQMDLTASSFEDGEFSCVLDKGTLDALMTDSSPEVVEMINKYFSELTRILRVGGRYVCVTLLQEHIIAHVLNWFPKNGWMVRVCRCEDAEKSQSDSGSFSFPVFVVICTKFKQMPNFKPVVEIQFHGEEVKRVETTDQVIQNVAELQQYALLRHNLQSQRVAGENMAVELCDSINGGCRYTLHIVDSPKKSNSLKFAVFIVPHGREQEWMFGTASGREKLAESAGASRLIVVHLARDQTYDNLKAIQDELSAKVMELAPSKLPAHTKVPFLSVGEDLGHREERIRGHSQFSGDYVVEDVHPPEASKLRRLIFLANQNVIQSEAKLLVVKDKKKKKEKLTIDYSYLSCEHHLAMVGGLGLIPSGDVLLVGLGGGPLATYIHKYIPKVTLTAVELDPSMVEVAKEWFGFVPDSRLKVEVGDGLDYIAKKAEEGTKFSVVLFDVDSKDSSVGMSCPPRDFVERSFLEKVASCLTDGGLLILNLVCRDEKLKAAVISDIKALFPSVLCQQIPEEVNCILFCSLSSQQANLKSDFEKGLREINKSLKQYQKTKEDVINTSEVCQNLSIL
ncbi:eEF1A lysine and N-terminal methyltransferase-like [Penaeus chinensis]|uniref:eEF1A lysine and N-terminal methyltransferase-like n=1 Tax=Penaeus chinensis TaxID=139456 RepID=UPI001FB75057|nr:eEF1A lysine and N-terminal methyltransferase-like [Penaeus chinensis]